MKLSVVDFITDSTGIFFISDNFWTVWTMYDGSLDFPLLGNGDKYGESVSTRSFSIGIDDTVLANSEDFLNVIIPLTEI